MPGHCSPFSVSDLPINGVLVKLAKLPVDGEDVHVVVLLEVQSQEVQGVISSLQPLLVLVDLLHLLDKKREKSIFYLILHIKLHYKDQSSIQTDGQLDERKGCYGCYSILTYVMVYV